MRLQLSFDLAVEIRHVGNLVLIGTAEKYSNDGDSTIVTFLLNFAEDADLVQYLHPQGGFRPGSLLYQIFVGEGSRVMEPATNPSQILVFTREVEGNLRNAQKFLHATGDKLLLELLEIEENELWMQELDDQMSWAAGRHFMCDCPMTDFKRPRHE